MPATVGQTAYVWQIDPDKCMACGRCQINCVLDVSAVKSVNCFALCGYCDVCTGYFPTKDFVLDTGADRIVVYNPSAYVYPSLDRKFP